MHSRVAEADAAADPACRRPIGLADAGGGPVAGLSTDYLNHFHEAVMLLEMLATAPEYRSDLADWRPRSYPEHFARSHLSQRDLALAAYHRLEPPFRQEFDALCAAMNAAVLQAQRGIGAEPAEPAQVGLALQSAAALRELIAKASAAIQTTYVPACR